MVRISKWLILLESKKYISYQGRTLLCGAILTSCTSFVSPSSPPQKTPSSASALPKDPLSIAPLRRWPLADPRGRYSTKAEALERPAVSEEPGYLRIQLPIGARHPVHCFVYEGPIDAGQAVTRLLRAVSVEVEFSKIRVLQVKEVNDEPLVILRGDFDTKIKGQLTHGAMKLAVIPRPRFPIVCTHESLHLDNAFVRIAQGFATDFRVNRPEEIPRQKGRLILKELWQLRAGGLPIGFSSFQVYASSSQVFTSLQIRSTFVSVKERLETSDSVILEKEDSDGLFMGRWLDLINTKRTLQIMVERKKDSTTQYRFLGQVANSRKQGTFDAPSPLRSTFAGYKFLAPSLDKYFPPSTAQSQPEPSLGEATLNYLQYVPGQTVTGPSSILYNRGQDNAKLSIKKGELELQVTLGPDALPRRRAIVGSQSEAVLLKRTLLARERND